MQVIDFGSSCFENEKLYSYIQSRFYRAPEVILGLGYGIEIDMWSFGCVIAELYNGIPMFPGENERDQLNYMIEYLGIPPKDMIIFSKKKNLFFDDNNIPLQIPNSRGKIRIPNTKKIEKFLRGADENFIDFVKVKVDKFQKCLVIDVSKRIKPEDAISHPWIVAGIPKEILSFHKNLIEQNRFKDTKKTHSVDKVKPISELKRDTKTDYINYHTHMKKIVSKSNYGKKNKSDNSFANKTD